MKHILILETSPRIHGNSNMLAQSFARGATEVGHEVETISLVGK